MTVIVAGTMEFDPATVEEATVSARELIAGAYTEQGCIHYAWTLDPLHPGRIYVFEEWASQADFAAHLATHWYTDMGAHIRAKGVKSASVKKYRVDLSEPVYDPQGRPRADFFTAT